MPGPPDIQGMLSDPDFNSLDPVTQRSTLAHLDPDFANLSDQDYSTFRQQMNGASSTVKNPSAPVTGPIPGLRGMALPGVPAVPLPGPSPDDPIGLQGAPGSNPQLGIKRNLTDQEWAKTGIDTNIPIFHGANTFARGMDELVTGEDKRNFEQRPGIRAGNRPAWDVRLGGAAKAIEGLGEVAAPAMVPAAIAAPAATIAGTGTGIGADAAVRVLAKALGAKEGTRALAGDVAGIGAGGTTADWLAPKTGASVFATDDPYAAFARVFKPKPSAEGVEPDLPTLIQAVKKYNPGFKPTYDKTTGHTNIPDAFNTAWQKMTQAFEPYMTRIEGWGNVPHQKIVDALQAAAARMPASEQPAVQELIAREAQDWANLTPRQFMERIDLKNARNPAFYNQSTPNQSKALAEFAQKADIVGTNAARDTIYPMLDPETLGMRPRYIRAIAGQLKGLRNDALAKEGPIAAEQSLTPFGRWVEPKVAPIKAAWKGIRGSPGEGFAYLAGSEGRSIPLLQKAFSAVQGEFPAPPTPQQPFYPTTPPGRQLGPGAIRLGSKLEPTEPPSQLPPTTPYDPLVYKQGLPANLQEARPPMASVSPRVNPVTAKTSQPSVYGQPVVQSNSFAQQMKNPASTSVKRLDVGSEVMHRGRAAKVKAVNPDGTADIEYSDAGPDLSSPGGR